MKRPLEYWTPCAVHYGPPQGTTKRFPKGNPIATLVVTQTGIDTPGADVIVIRPFHPPMSPYKGAKFYWGNQEWVINTYSNWDKHKRFPAVPRLSSWGGERLADGYMLIDARRVK
jgi:hypothetical protein